MPAPADVNQETTDGTSAEPEVGLARMGDRRAFEALYRRHVGRVYALCVRMAGDRLAAEELTQDVFVRAWHMLSTFRGESKFSTWLHRLAVNVVLVARRSDRRRTLRVFTAGDISPYDTGVSAGFGEAVDLEAAIAVLPAQARMTFVLHDIEGYRHEEIAAMMGLAVGTTKAQLHRARALLKEALRQ